MDQNDAADNETRPDVTPEAAPPPRPDARVDQDRRDEAARKRSAVMVLRSIKRFGVFWPR